ncbi:sucrose nonfermenting 4-like protein [Miscanthus floridulus]|uniref:sucrose nonfermenting 4-like protein n=1 Tax=Miscanthus floridulus TaxID=154761 RepID=UPI0034598FC6
MSGRGAGTKAKAQQRCSSLRWCSSHDLLCLSPSISRGLVTSLLGARCGGHGDRTPPRRVTGKAAIHSNPTPRCAPFRWVPKIGDPNSRPLAMLRPNASLSSALNMLVQAGVSSIPTVDENDALLDTYSRSDITALAKDKVYTHVRLDEMTIHQALQLGQDANTPFGFFNGQRCQMCLRSDPLLKVME